jgi:hypothetical protein
LLKLETSPRSHVALFFLNPRLLHPHTLTQLDDFYSRSTNMCIRLIQTYACIHQKIICTTPCPHALYTGYQIFEDENGGISRSDSTVSSIAPSPRRNEAPSPHHPPSSTPLRNAPSPLLMGSPPSTPYSPAHVSRSTSSGQPSPLSPPPGYPSPSAEPVTIEPNFCAYHFPRHLPQSKQPCIECYMLPKWEFMAERWMKSYREGHPLDRVENVERDSGVEALRERERMRKEGLLNVFVHGDEGAGRLV